MESFLLLLDYFAPYIAFVVIASLILLFLFKKRK